MKKIIDPSDAQAWPKSASVTENSLVELRNQFTGDQKSMKSCEERERSPAICAASSLCIIYTARSSAPLNYECCSAAAGGDCSRVPGRSCSCTHSSCCRLQWPAAHTGRCQLLQPLQDPASASHLPASSIKY